MPKTKEQIKLQREIREIDKSIARGLFEPAMIYTLRNPLTDTIYYVGKTNCERLEDRLKNGHPWLKTSQLLKGKELLPIIELVEETIDAFADDRERYWIEQFRAWGFPLENSRKKTWYGKNDDYLYLMDKYPEENIWGTAA